MDSHFVQPVHLVPWNKGRQTGQKAPLKRKEVWAIRIRLQLAQRVRDPALFNLAIDSTLRACDLCTASMKELARNPATLREVKRLCGFFLEMSSPFPRPY